MTSPSVSLTGFSHVVTVDRAEFGIARLTWDALSNASSSMWLVRIPAMPGNPDESSDPEYLFLAVLGDAWCFQQLRPPSCVYF